MLRLWALIMAAGISAACSDWTEPEAVDQEIERPHEQNPALWQQYTKAVRAYKQSEHFFVYARLYNSPQPASSEKDFMRCLPDSLDFVSLTNADNFSKYDAEDMKRMRVWVQIKRLSD